MNIILPLDCFETQITFDLNERKDGKISSELYSQYNYTCDSSDIFDTWLVFERPLSSTPGIQYTINGRVTKRNFESVLFDFDQSFTTKFATYLIIIIVISILFLILILIGLIVYIKIYKPAFFEKLKPKKSRYKKYSVKLSAVNGLLDYWSESQGFIEEWKHLIAADQMHVERGHNVEKSAALNRINRTKNRYINILPYDHTRVKILNSYNDDSNDYINANFVAKSKYIACQGPKDNTLEDFWQMVIERNVKTIVMLTKLIEKNKDKCAEYWPNRIHSTINYGEISVTLISQKERPHYTIRKIRIERVCFQDFLEYLLFDLIIIILFYL
jgi:hypothetical protein